MRIKGNCKFYYVYIITNNILNKQYVGSKMCYKEDPNNDGYWGSSRNLNNDYKIYGKENFSKEILEYYDEKISMLRGETKHILEHKTLAPDGYNRFLPSQRERFYMGGYNFSEESREKNRKSHLGKKPSDKTKKLMSESRSGISHPGYGKNRSQEIKDKIGQSKKGQIHSMESKIKISKAFQKENHPLFGKHHSQETILKMSLKHRGVIPSEETKDKMKKSHLAKEKILCPHCNRFFDAGNYKKSHGDKCKKNI